MDRLLRALFSLKELKVRRDDDFVDRLTRTYTSTLLVLFAIVVSTKQFVGEPIACWCPAYFTDSHKAYANTECWLSDKFYMPSHDQAFTEEREQYLSESDKRVSYYQWVPLLLLSMSVFSLIPSLIWRFLNLRSGIDICALVDSALTCERATYAEIRDRTVRYMVNQIDRYLMTQRDYGKGCGLRIKRLLARYCVMIGGKRQGNYLQETYLIMKVVYLIICVGQIFLLNLFLGKDFHLYGIQAVHDLYRGTDWKLSERFPRVTLCSFDIRHQGRVHPYIVQCVLTINLFNEKIFLVVWFWYVFLTIATLFSLVQWVYRATYWPGQWHYVKKKLRSYEVTHRPKANLRKFVQCYLRRDGLFLVRMIGMNVGEIVAVEVLAGLWENYSPEKSRMSENPTSSRSLTNVRGPSNGRRMDVV